MLIFQIAQVSADAQAEKSRLPVSDGAMRIQIEAQGNQVKAMEYAGKWQGLVSSLASILFEELVGLKGKEREERFITVIWGILHSNYRMVGIPKEGAQRLGVLADSLERGEFNCDSSSFLVYDVGKRLGIDISLVIVHGHALIKTPNFFLETTNGAYSPSSKLSSKYSSFHVIDPANTQCLAYISRGLKRAAAGDQKGSLEDLDKAIGIQPAFPDAYYNRAIAHMRVGNPAKAIADLTQAIALNPEFVEAYVNRGNIYGERGDPDRAIADYTKAIETPWTSSNTPDFAYAAAYFNRGEKYMKRGEYKKAVDDFTNAIRNNHGPMPMAYESRAEAYYRLGEIKLAEADKKKNAVYRKTE